MPYYDFDEEERRRREQEAIRDAYFQEWRRQNNSAHAPKVKAADRREMAAANQKPVFYNGNVNPNNDQLPAMTTAEMEARRLAKWQQQVTPAANAAAAMVQNAPVDQYMMKRFLPNISDKSLEQTFAEAAKIDPNAKPAEPEQIAQVRPYTSALDQATLIADNLFKTKKYPTQPRQSALQGTNVPDGGIQQPNYASKNPVIPQPSAQETYTPDEELQIADINVKTLPKKEQESLKSVAKKQQEAYSVPLFDASNIDNLDNYNVMLQKAQKEQEMVAERDEFQRRNNLTDKQMSNFLYYQQMLNDKEKNDKVRTDIRNSLHEGSGASQVGNALALNAISIANSPYRGAQAIAGNVAQRVLGNRPDGFGIQTSGSPYDHQNFSQAVQEETGNRIAETGAGEVGRFLYNTGVSAAESAYNMALTGMAGTAIGGAVEGKAALETAQKVLQNASLLPFGANAYASTYQEARNRGLDDKSAALTATVSGAAEIITEKVSLDSLWDMARGNKRFARNAIVNALAQAGIEGSEEVASDLINAVADRIINGDRSEYEQDVQSIMLQNGGDEESARKQASRNFIKNVGMSFLGGAISGGVMGSAATAVGTVSNQAKANQMFDQNTDYADLADSIDTNRESYENKSAYQSALKAQEIASELDQKQKSGETITNKDKRNLYTNMMDAVQVESETRENRSKQEETVENTTKQEEKTTKPEETTQNTQLSEEDTTPDTTIPVAETTVPTTETAAPTTEQEVPTTKQTVPVEEKVTANEQENVTSEQNSEENVPESNVSEENNVTSDVPEQYRATYVNDRTLADQMQKAKNPQELVEAYQNAVDSRQGDEHALKMAQGYYDAYAGLMAKAKDNNFTLEDIAKAAETTLSAQRAYEAGLNEQQIDKSVLSSKAQQAYNDGLSNALASRERNVSVQKERIKQLAESYPTTLTKQAFEQHYVPGMNADVYQNGFDRAYNAGRQVDTFTLPADQIMPAIDKAWDKFKNDHRIIFSQFTENQAQEIFYEGLNTASRDHIAAVRRSEAERLLGRQSTGTFIDERANAADDNTARSLAGLASATGINFRIADSLPNGSNGYFANGEIVINASKNKDLVTAFHELGEFTDSWNTEEFQSVVKSGMQTMEEILGPKAYREMRKNYEQAYAVEFAQNGKTDADLDKEIFCDQLFNIMSHEDGIEKLFAKIDQNASAQQAKTFKEKLSDILGKIIDSFKNLISGQTLNSYQRKVAEDSLLRMQDLQDRVIEAMANAVNTYQQVETAVHKEMGNDAILEYDQNGDFQMASSKDTDSVLVNIATVDRESRSTLPTTNEKLRKVLKEKGHTQAEIDDAIDMINRQAQLLEEVALGYREMEEALSADIITDITGQKQVLRSFVKNGEYPVNIDFMTICKKRQAYMRVLTDLIDDGTFANVSFSPNAIVKVNDILKANGYETACLGCFVESRRLQVQKWSETFVDAWNRQVAKALDGKQATPFNFGKNEKGTSSLTMAEIERMQEEFNAIPKKQKNEKGNIKLGASVPVETKMANLLKKMPSMAHTLEVGDIIKTNGVANLRSNYGELYSLLLQWYGSNTPKVNQDFNPYNGEFADLTYSFMRSEIGESIPWQTKYRNWAKAEIAKEKGAAYKPGTDEVVDRALRKYLFDIGGARLQSFSDFLIENSLDYFQMVADLAAKEYPMHAYSKEISFARLFGMTGMKLNMSLIPVVNRAAGSDMAGLNPDGSYAGWGDYERHMVIDDKSFIQSIGWKDAIALQLDPRYAKNVGTIAIGISDAHIRKMLNDPLIRMVIPYHKSGMNPEYAKAMNIDYYTDYTDFQNTTVKQYFDRNGNPDSHLVDGIDKKKVKTGIEEFNFNEAAQRLGDAKAAAQEYLEWCAKEHPVMVGGKKIGTCTFTPKFEQFTKGEGSENYYKVLEDFNMYDSITGENASQQAVTMTYPGAENALTPAQLAEYEQRLRDTGEFTEADIKKYLERAQMSMEDIIRKEAAERNAIRRANDDNYDSTIKEIRDALQEFASTPEERLEKYAADKEKSKPRNSVDVDTEGTQLTEEQAEYFKDSKIRDENGNLRVMYHGTQNQFTVFDFSQGGKNGTAEGFGIYITDNPEVSQSYGDRIIKGYANITKPAYSDRRTIKRTELSKLIKETVAMEAQNLLDDYDGDIKAAEKDTWISNYTYTYDKSMAAAISEVTNNILDMNDNDMDIIQEVMNGMAIRDYNRAVEFYDVLTKTTGYDGFLTNWTNEKEGTSSLIALAFRSNQIKNVDNLNPSEDPDIRYSKDIQALRDSMDAPEVDFTEMITKNDEDADTGMKAVLEEGSKILKGQQVDQQMVRKIARRVTRKYGSAYDINQYADDVSRVFAYAQGNDITSDSEELVRLMTDIAKPVIEGAVVEKNDELKKEIRKNVRGMKLDLTEIQHAEVVNKYDSYQNYKKAMRKHGIEISANGESMNRSWGEIQSAMLGTLQNADNEGDQPIKLLEALDSLDKKVVQNGFGMDNQEAAKDLAMDMIAGYFDEMGKKQTSKASVKDIAELKKQVAEAKRIGADYKAQIKKEYEERYDEALKDLKQARQLASEETMLQVAALRAQNRHDIQRRLDAQEKAKQKSEIQKTSKNLLSMLANPTNKKHVPLSLEAPVLDLLSAIDFVGPKIDRLSDGRYQTKVLVAVEEQGQLRRRFETYVGDSYQEVMQKYQEAIASGYGSKSQRTWQQKLGAVLDMYAKAGTEGDDAGSTDMLEILDKPLYNDIQKILRDNEGVKTLSSLTASELQTISKAIKNITKAINKIDQMYSSPQRVSELATETMTHAAKVRDTKVRRRGAESLKDFFTLDNATPETFFHGLGKSGEKVFRMLTRANNVKARDIRTAQEYMADVLKDVKQSEIDSMTGEKAKIIYEDGTMRLDVGDVMYLYMLLKRKDAESHKYGGFEMDDKEIKGKVYRDTKPHFLDQAKLIEITDKLTPKQKEIAEKMQKFLAVNCSEWGNETTIEMFGYEKFTDPNYIPMTVDKKTVRTNAQNSAEGMINSIRESGFTKNVIPNANNPLIIRNIFDVFAEHVTNMAAYHAYAAPLTDLIRWNNYKTTEEIKEGDVKYGRQHTVKEAIDDIYGKGGQSYLVQLVRDINQMEKQTRVGTARFGGALTSRYKAAATLANLRVVAQQPTAWFRAGEMIDAKYMAAGLMPNKAADKMQAETSDISWIKAQGNIDGYITHSMKNTITRASSTREKINDAAGWLAGKADDVTWNKLYRAVYAEQAAKYDGDLTSEEFAKKVNDRFDDIIARTQVVDGTLMRSQLMRSSDRKNISVSAFMAEPTKSYNMFLRDYIDLTQGAKENKKVKPADLKHLSRTAAVYLITNVANAVMQSIFDAERDDDEDKSYIEKLLNAFGINTDSEATFRDKALTFLEGNFVDDLNMLNNIPIINDMYDLVWSAVKKTVWGENTYNSSTSDFDVAGLSELVKAWNYTWDKIKKNENTKVTLYGAIAQDVKALSQVSGIPAYNLMRECVALYNNLNDLWGGDNIRRTAAGKSELIAPVMKDINNGVDFTESLNQALAKGAKYDDIYSAIREKYKNNYIDAMENGETHDAELIENRLETVFKELKEKEGKEYKPRVKAWYTDFLKENGRDPVEAVFKSLDSGSDYKKAIEQAVSLGKTYDSIESSVTKNYKKQYIDLMRQGKRSEATKLENRLVMIYNYLNDKEGQKPTNNARIQKWYTDWQKENGVEQIELTGGSESSGSRMIDMTNVESMDVPISTEPANIWGNAYVTRQPRGTSYWINGTSDWEKEHHTNAARMIQEAFAHGYDPSQPYENDFRRNSEWHMKQINKRNYARKKTYGSGGGNAVAWKSPE